VGQKKPGRKAEPASKRRIRWPRWTGFGNKTIWDWLQLLIVPLALVGLGLAFDLRQQAVEDRRAERERDLAEQRAQDEALRAYLDQMGQLILERNLLEAEDNDPVYALAHARTRTILARLDAEQNRTVTRFLTTTGLTGIERGDRPTISLLANIELRDANMSGADLSGADLGGANLLNAKGDTEEQLDKAASLEGATMPDGSKHP
jgi:hypothetical protein